MEDEEAIRGKGGGGRRAHPSRQATPAARVETRTPQQRGASAWSGGRVAAAAGDWHEGRAPQRLRKKRPKGGNVRLNGAGQPRDALLVVEDGIGAPARPLAHISTIGGGSPRVTTLSESLGKQIFGPGNAKMQEGGRAPPSPRRETGPRCPPPPPGPSYVIQKGCMLRACRRRRGRQKRCHAALSW